MLAIKSFGWRSTYGALGIVAGIIGLATMLFVKEPVKKIQKMAEDNKKKNDEANAKIDAHYSEEELVEMKEKPFKYLLSNPVNKWVMFGSFVRNIGGSVTTYYLPVFFLKNFAEFKSQYSAANSLVLSVGGLLSSVIAGMIADKFEYKSKMTKAYICMSGCLLALPLYAVATL